MSICYGIGGLEEIESQREKGDANLVRAYIVTLQTDEFLSIMEKELKRTRRLKQTWEHTVKINTDGAYDCNSGMGGLGFVIQDSNGEVVQAGVGKLRHLKNAFHNLKKRKKDAFHAELLACMAGVKAANHLWIHKVIVETDCTMVKLALDGTSHNPMTGIRVPQELMILQIRC